MSQAELLQQDADNRARALELRSFIVEAPAGAGKTELLTQRYLKLLGVVREPEEIVAITFTNKAAAEMRGRVLQSLQDAQDGAPIDKPHKQETRRLALGALERSGTLGWNLLGQPARLRINTIDSLCTLLARQMPLLSRFGAQPGVTDDALAHYEEAAQRALAMLENEHGEGPVTAALHYLDNDTERLSGLLAQMLAKRDQWQHHAGRQSLQEQAETALRHLVQHDIARAGSILTPALQQRLMPAARYAASHLACDEPVALLLDWDKPIPLAVEALPLWRAVCELLLTQKDEWRRSVNVNLGFPANDESKPYKQALAEIIAAMPDPRPLARIRELPGLQHGDEEWQIVGALGQLLQLAAAQLLTVFQEAGEVDFLEVSRRALDALGEDDAPTDLALHLDYRIQHLLVDEFQDTSPSQVKLLEKLTAGWEPEDGRTVFCVGDPMQSIYRFRKAEVGLFLQAERYGIGHLHLECLHLRRNNRSCPAVVDWVNQSFAGVFPAQDSETRGAIAYREFAATRPSSPGEQVKVHALVAASGTASGDLATLEAICLADLIEQERRDYPGRSIAVLVRARHHLQALVAEIRRNRPGLDFQAVEVEALAGRQTVQDVLSLTRALFHRADRVNWLAILRAPWCGLTLADLHALAAYDHNATLWQLMQDEARVARLSEDGRQRLRHVREVLQETFAHQGRQPVRRWVESVWLRLGGPGCLWDEGDVRDVEAIFGLIEKLDATGNFHPEALEHAMLELYAAPDVQADETLQFMTLHKSKGLEFDTVILPGLHRQPKSSDSPLLLWEQVTIDDAGPELVAAPWVPRHKRNTLPSCYDFLHGLEAERSANEAARVLYVGATRAERRLHLVGAVSLNTKGELKPPSNTFLQLLWDAVGEDFARAAEALLTAASGSNSADFIPRLVRLPRPWEAGLPGQDFSPLTDRTPAAAMPDGGGRNCLEADCGTLAHRYVEMMAGAALGSWTAGRIATLDPAMVRWLMRQGHGSTDAESGAQRVQSALCTTLVSADGQWVLRDRPDAASELALSSVQDDGIATHVVDRTFVEDGVRWIIDYKSDRLGEEVTEASLLKQAENYRPQLERYAGLFEGEGLPLRMGVFFMAYGRLTELE